MDDAEQNRLEYASRRLADSDAPRSWKPIIIGLSMVHGFCLLNILALCAGGPPMGESEITPWDYWAWGSIISSFVVMPVCWVILSYLHFRRLQKRHPLDRTNQNENAQN